MNNNELTLLLIIDNSLIVDIKFVTYDNVKEYSYFEKTFNWGIINKIIYNEVSSIQNIDNKVNYENFKKEIIELIKKEVQATFLEAEKNSEAKNDNMKSDNIILEYFYEEIMPDIELRIEAIFSDMEDNTTRSLPKLIKSFKKDKEDFKKEQEDFKKEQEDFKKEHEDFKKKNEEFAIRMGDIIKNQEAAKEQLDDLNEIKGQIFAFVGTIISAIAVLGIDIKFSASMFENFVIFNSGFMVFIYFFGSQIIFIGVLGGLIWFILYTFNKNASKGSKDEKGSKDLKDSKDLK